VTADGSPEPSGKATAKLTWDDFYLYVFITIADTDVSSPYKTHDDSLWKADAVEMFVDADGNRAGYIELQVNPHNTTFDSWFAGPRGSQGDVAWDSGMVTAVKVRGTPGPGDTDQGWDVEIGIPWSAIRGRDGNMAVKLPPRIGDRWKLNIVRVDIKSNDTRQSASSWNRIGYGDWHALDKMLTAVFADPTGSIVSPAENPQQPEPGTLPGAGSGSSAGSAASIAPAPETGSGSSAGSAGAGSASSIAPPRTGSGLAPGTGAGSSATPRAGSNAAPRAGSGDAAPRGTGSATPSRGSAKPPPPPTPGSSSPPPAAAPISPAPGSGSSR
jgi:Carbohydrate family 9 binding domain-like